MKYTVKDKRIEFKDGPAHSLWITCGLPFSAFWLAVSQDDFDRIQIGDTIEILLTVVPVEVAAC